jgi:beta-glucanase (GH16 family)
MRMVLAMSILGAAGCVADEATALVAKGPRGDYSPADYVLDFGDDFDGSALDRSRWCTRYVFGAGPEPQVDDPECRKAGKGTLDFFNDEKQRYRDFNTVGEAMHVVRDGVLTLRATRTGPDPAGPFESAMIRSKHEFKPGPDRAYYVTARLRMPNVRGSWPAFWIISGVGTNGIPDWPPEITIVDAALNEVDDKANMYGVGSVVRGAQTRTGSRDVTYAHPDYGLRWGVMSAKRSLREVWIEAAVHWTDEGVCYFLDGVKIVCEDYWWVLNDGTPSNPAHVLVNLAVGGHWAGRHGINDRAFPTQLDVDHVRVYRGAARPMR